MASTRAAWIQKVPMRLATKPGVSLQKITPLPSLRSAIPAICSTASARVAGPLTISSSRM